MKKLFETHTIKHLQIKNRIAVPPMVCYHWTDEKGYAVQKNIDHYSAIAKGGAGLIIQEATCVSPHGRLAKSQLGLWEDGQIEGLKKIVDAVHAEGCPIFVQIHHAGIMSCDEPLDCPSDFTFDRPDGVHAVGHEMTAEKISLVKQQFVDACLRAAKAGYDGVELHCCHSYLLSEFMNSALNRRTDAYGRQPELLALEILKAVREVVPEGFIIGARLGGFEPALADAVAHAKTLEAHGIDFLDISYGFTYCSEPQKPESFLYKDIIYAAQEIKKAVNVPVFAVNSIQSAAMAEEILETTGVDMVDIGRGTLVNYNWANDAKAGRDVGSCLFCKACMWRIDYTKCPGHLRYLKNQQQ